MTTVEPQLALKFINALQAITANNEQSSNEIQSLKSELNTNPQNMPLFLHTFVTLNAFNNEHAVAFIKSLNLDPLMAAQYFPLNTGVDSQIIDVSSNRKYYQRVIGHNTRLTTFDLAQENIFGYSLLVFIFDFYEDPNEAWKQAEGVIGKFCLEPFRALSIYLISIICVYRSENRKVSNKVDVMIKYIEHSNWIRSPDFWPLVFDSDMSFLFLDLIVVLVTRKTLDFELACSYLLPTSDCFVEYDQYWRDEHLQGTTAKSNPLAMAMPLVDDDEDEEEQVVDSEGGNAVGEDSNGNDKMDVDLETEQRKKEEEARKEAAKQEELEKLHEERIGSVKCFLYFLGTTLCSVIENELDTVNIDQILSIIRSDLFVYKTSKLVNRGICLLAHQKLVNGESLESVLIDYVSFVSHNISVEPLWIDLNNALIELQQSANEGANNADALSLFRTYLLPSIDVYPHNQPFLTTLPSLQRLSLYTELQNNISQHNLLVKARFVASEKETRTVLKRLTKQNAADLTVPQLLVQFSKCPLPSLTVFVKQVESYNIGRLVAKSAAKIPKLALDILPLILMQQLTEEGKETRKNDGLHENMWFKLLAQFTGDVAVTCPDFDFITMLRLALSQFKQNNYGLIEVVEQLICRLSGCPEITNLNVIQILALNTLEPLRTLARADISGQETNLVKNLTERVPNSNLHVIILLALVRGYLVQVDLETDPKVIANRMDKISLILQIYIDVCGPSIELSLPELLDLGVPSPWAVAIKRTQLSDGEQLSGLNSVLETLFWSFDLTKVCYENRLYTGLKCSNEYMIKTASETHQKSRDDVLDTLKSKSTELFTETGKESELVNDVLLPRIFVSGADAVYTSKFLQILTDLSPQNLNIKELFSTLFSTNCLISLFSRSTPLEMENFALFVSDLFVYFIKSHLDGDLIREVHLLLTDAILKTMHPMASFTEISNCIQFLQRAGYVYPMFEFDGAKVLKRVQLLTIGLKNDDLLTASKSIYPQLMRREAQWVLNHHAVQEKFVHVVDKHNDQLFTRICASINIVPETVVKFTSPPVEAKPEGSAVDSKPVETKQNSNAKLEPSKANEQKFTDYRETRRKAPKRKWR